MALNRSTARRYAEAAFEIAERDGSMEAWLAAFTVARGRLLDDEVTRLLANPAVPAPARIKVLERLLGSDVSGPQRNLLALLIRRGRFETLPAVIREFDRLYRQREGIVEARVTSATALDTPEIEALKARLEQLTGKHIELTSEVDTALLGGVVVRVGDQLIDGSVQGRLERLRTDLSHIAI
jgi:F-type H+-transporting ATPase subunit delta